MKCYEKSVMITEEAIIRFANVTYDKNPLHLDEEYAKKTIFKGRIAHGMLLGSYLAAVLGSEFPGLGTIYLSQHLKFVKPVRIGDMITIKISIIELTDKNKVRLDTILENQRGEVVIVRQAIVIPPPDFVTKLRAET